LLSALSETKDETLNQTRKQKACGTGGWRAGSYRETFKGSYPDASKRKALFAEGLFAAATVCPGKAKHIRQSKSSF
jgi:hypothetical protein